MGADFLMGEDLKAGLIRWDGKSSAVIVACYETHHSAPDFVPELLRYLETPELQKAATWLLKRHQEAGHGFTHFQQKKIFRYFPDLEDWESRLHVLQILPAFDISLAEPGDLEDFLRDCLSAKNTFVRAWAYYGFYLFARHYPEYQQEAMVLFEEGLEKESASVKVRIRKALKEGF